MTAPTMTRYARLLKAGDRFTEYSDLRMRIFTVAEDAAIDGEMVMVKIVNGRTAIYGLDDRVRLR